MSVHDRMRAIEGKMKNLEARFGEMEPSRGLKPSTKPGSVTPGPGASGEAVNFESLLNSLTDDQRFAPGKVRRPAPVGDWKGDPSDYDGMIREASQKHGVDESLIRAVIRQESAFDPQATSHVGAQGLMQLMPETAAGLGVSDAYDPYQNIMGGTLYLRQLLDRFDGNMTKALAGYNAGPGAVEKYGGVPPYEETQNYVGSVLEFYRRYKTSRGESV